MAGCVRDRSDGNRKREAKCKDRGQQPGLAARAFVIHHLRILPGLRAPGNRY